MSRLATFALLSALTVSACAKGTPATAEAQPATAKAVARAKAAKAGAKAKADKAKADTHAVAPVGPRRYVVPFAWEASQEEPLAQTRAYLKEILTDNRIYMEHGPSFFAAFADGQKPRATVVTCSDSRVHTPAFDTTPENDDFMIRNIGNQIANSEGSVEYGVEHLETPVLLILGHTGCGAVKAAMSDISQLSAPLKRELENIHASKPKAGASANAAWADAVLANVHAQVATALQHFGERVAQGKLTVIGAVYDFRADLGQGVGKVTIIDVNGNGEPERMQAFVDAIEAEGSATGKKKEVRGGKGEGARGSLPAPSQAAISDALAKIPGLVVQNGHKSVNAPDAH